MEVTGSYIVAITDPLSNIGRAVCKNMLQYGLRVKLLVDYYRDVSVLEPLLENPDVSIVRLDPASPEAFNCFDDVRAVFFFSLSEISYQAGLNRRLIMELSQSSVHRTVYLSEPHFDDVPGSSLRSQMQFHNENLFNLLRLPVVFLRCNFTQDSFAAMGLHEGLISMPATDGVMSLVARQDIVEIIGKFLTDAELPTQRVFDITGPKALSLPDIVDTINEVHPGSVRLEWVENPTDSNMFKALIRDGWTIGGFLTAVQAITDGEYAQVSLDVADILGRPALSFKDNLINQMQS